MGKSATVRMLHRLCIPVHDADATVHRLMGPRGAAVGVIEDAFPGCTGPDGVDRAALARTVFGDAGALTRLEGILHPMVRDRTRSWLDRQARSRRTIVVLDIPLLFETRRDVICDAIVVVSAPAAVQRQRALSRPGMTGGRLDAILARQTPDREKRRRADFVLPTGRGYRATLAALGRALAEIETWPDRSWPPTPYRERADARNRPRYRNHRP